MSGKYFFVVLIVLFCLALLSGCANSNPDYYSERRYCQGRCEDALGVKTCGALYQSKTLPECLDCVNICWEKRFGEGGDLNEKG